MSLVTTLGTKIRAAESATSALDDLRTDLLASLPTTTSTSDDNEHKTATADKTTTPTPAAPSASTAARITSAATAPASSTSPTTLPSTSSASNPTTSPTLPSLSVQSLSDALPGPDDADDVPWELSLHALTSELDSITEQHNVDQQHVRRQHAQLIAADITGLTPLPHVDPAAAAFHSAVIDTYDRLSGGALGLRGKQAFLSRKLKAKQGRAAKRAEEVYERQATKLCRGRQKAKARRKAQY